MDEKLSIYHLENGTIYNYSDITYYDVPGFKSMLDATSNNITEIFWDMLDVWTHKKPDYEIEYILAVGSDGKIIAALESKNGSDALSACNISGWLLNMHAEEFHGGESYAAQLESGVEADFERMREVEKLSGVKFRSYFIVDGDNVQQVYRAMK